MFNQNNLQEIPDLIARLICEHQQTRALLFREAEWRTRAIQAIADMQDRVDHYAIDVLTFGSVLVSNGFISENDFHECRKVMQTEYQRTWADVNELIADHNELVGEIKNSFMHSDTSAPEPESVPDGIPTFTCSAEVDGKPIEEAAE